MELSHARGSCVGFRKFYESNVEKISMELTRVFGSFAFCTVERESDLIEFVIVMWMHFSYVNISILILSNF